MNPHRLTWGFSRTIPVAMIVGIATLLAWLVSREPKRFPLQPPVVILLVFIAWIGVTTIFAHVPDLAVEKWQDVMKIMLMTLLTVALMGTRERLNAMIWVIVVSIGFYAVKGGIFVILTGGQHMVLGPEQSYIGSNNALGLALIMILPLMRYLQLQVQSSWVRWGLMGAMALSLLSILASYSRGAFLALGAMVIVMWLKSRRRLMFGICMCFGLGIALLVMPEKWYEEIESIGRYEEDTSAQSRFEMWKLGYRIAVDNPILGGGFEVFTDYDLYQRYGIELERVKSFHSNYFEALGEQGFIGLTLYLCIGIATWITGTSIIMRSRGRPEFDWAAQLAAMVQVGLAGYAIGGLFLNKAYFDLYYHLVAIMVLTRAILVQSETAASSLSAAGKTTLPSGTIAKPVAR